MLETEDLRTAKNPNVLSGFLRRSRTQKAETFAGYEGEIVPEELHEECGVFGVYGAEHAAVLTHCGLIDLQHRGQNSSGIAASDGRKLRVHKGNGLVAEVYRKDRWVQIPLPAWVKSLFPSFSDSIHLRGDVDKLRGKIAVGHDRYKTSDGRDGTQPICREGRTKAGKRFEFALAHNGNISSPGRLKEFLASKRISFENLTDSEMVAEAIAARIGQGASLETAVSEIYPLIVGAFSILVMDKSNLIAIRDRCGIRPLSVGTIGEGRYAFSSETAAFDRINAVHLRDVAPGEMVVVNEKGLKAVQLAEGNQKLDIFEFVYFSRPDSVLLGKQVHGVRENFGKELAKEHPLDVDIVIAVPNTAIPAAAGYAEALTIPYKEGLFKARDRGRTFIEDTQVEREKAVERKLRAIPHVLKGKRVAVLDDSIVRGTTSKKIVRMLRDAGAAEVHFVVTSPPFKYPDFYGIDTPDQKDLIAANMTEDQIRDFLGADSLHYLSYEGMIRATGLPEDVFNTSCFTGRYPIEVAG